MNLLISVRTKEGVSAPIFMNVSDDFNLTKVVNGLLNHNEGPETTHVEMIFSKDEMNIQDLVRLLTGEEQSIN